MTIDKSEIVKQLKQEYPTLRSGSDESGYEEIIGEEYEMIIDSWAENVIAEEEKATAAAEASAKRQALLDKLGITEEEAKLLLG